jgi:HD-GYP domain-containing protein (c-di-GMP phosphodiesterase class II)
VNGTGYPQGLHGRKINEYAKILAVVDTYEALTHPRPHRDALLPFDAMREILKDKARFDPHYLKVLIEQISIYPVGSWVELNSGEVGKVVKINKSNPLRPILDIIFDAQFQKIKEPKSIDLTKTPNLYIKKTLSEQEVDK